MSIVDKAEIPNEPSNINHPRTILIFCGIGFVIAIIVVILVDVFDTTIKSREMVEDVLDIPVLASIPFSEGEGGKNK